MHRVSLKLVFAVVVACMWLIGCRHASERRFELTGRVVSVDKEKGQVTLAHEEIKGFMNAMTMPFTVKDQWALNVLEPGQRVDAVLVVLEDRSWIEQLRISKGESVQDTPLLLPFPKRGEIVPDFTLRNQDDAPIRLSQYRGQNLLLTFIYTRCPLPDFCPRTSRNFSEIHRGIRGLASPSRKSHLLTISFDTEHDTAAVLRAYAGRYMHPPLFEEWEFATGTPDEIRNITGYFGLAYQQDSGQFIHSLVTALIGPDGKLVHLYLGNGWKPQEILALLQ